MLTSKEVIELFTAIWSNWVSLLSGILGIIFTVISIWWPNPNPPLKRIALILGLLSLFLSPVYAWRDEYRARQADKISRENERNNIQNAFQKELDAKNAELKEKKDEIAQLRDIRGMQRIMLRPTIGLSFYYNDDGAGWKLQNNGPGTATVKWFSAEVDNIPQTNWKALADSLGLPSPIAFNFQIPIPNQQIPPNTNAHLFWIKPGQQANVLMKNSHRVRLEICYCSLAEQCWLTTDRIDEPEKTSSCKPEPKVQFRNPPMFR